MSDSAESMRILHVEDDPDFADLTADFLGEKDERFEIETAPDVDEGMDLLDGTEFDCVISDYDMPGRNGLEFLELVREEYPDLPFILFTGKGSEEVASDAVSAGVSDYLQKQPGSDQFTLLANRVTNAIEQYRVGREVEETRRRFRTLVEEATDAMLIVQPDGTISYATQSAESVLGRSPGALVGSDGFEPIHPDDVEYVMEEFAALIENPEERRTAEFRYEKPDGSTVWVEVRGRNLIEDPVIGGVVVYARDTTKRKERELELRETERRYRAIFNDPNILVGMIDVDGTVLDVNETALEFVDGGVDDVVGRPFWETQWFEHSDGVKDDVEQWVRRAREGEYVEFEADLRRPDGEPYAVQGVFRPVTDDRGEVVSIIVSDREITEQKERERELERINDFFTEAERLGNLGAWEFDAPGNVTWTEGTRRIHEVDDDFVPTTDDGLAFLHEDDRDEVEAAVEEALSNGEPYDVEARMITATGDERWIRTRGEPVDGDGETVRGYIQDVTEQKEREQALRQAKSQLEAAVEAGAVGTWEWTIPENELVVGAEFARKFGVDPAEARSGVPLERFTTSIHEDDRERVERQIETAVDTCGDYVSDYRVWDADGDLRWVVARGRVECDEDGNPLSFPGALIDITDRKEAEEELRRKNERLDEFASVVSHDLRNPLSVATGRLKLAQAECDSSHLDKVGQSLDRMQALIEDLLTLARDDGARVDVAPVEPTRLVESCWDNVVTSDATLIVDLDRTIRGDQRRLRQLFENVFRNAVEHGGETVSVTVGESSGGFYVADDGPGIPEDDREAVFEVGYTTAEDGNGLGLSIIRKTANAHGWEVSVTESEGGGARFEFTGVTFET